LSGLVNSAAGQTNILVIIDPLAETFFRNSSNNHNGHKYLILPGEGNPVTIIGEELVKASYDEIHLYVLSKPGSLIFDEINIIPENIEEYADAFKSWKPGIKKGCELIIHSEDVLSDPGSDIIIQIIGEYTGCKVTVKK